jgi:hypothetical protein
VRGHTARGVVIHAYQVRPRIWPEEFSDARGALSQQRRVHIAHDCVHCGLSGVFVSGVVTGGDDAFVRRWLVIVCNLPSGSLAHCSVRVRDPCSLVFDFSTPLCLGVTSWAVTCVPAWPICPPLKGVHVTFHLSAFQYSTKSIKSFILVRFLHNFLVFLLTHHGLYHLGAISVITKVNAVSSIMARYTSYKSGPRRMAKTNSGLKYITNPVRKVNLSQLLRMLCMHTTLVSDVSSHSWSDSYPRTEGMAVEALSSCWRLCLSSQSSERWTVHALCTLLQLSKS